MSEVEFPCIGRTADGKKCSKHTRKGICNMRGGCWNSLESCFSKLYPKIMACDSPSLEVNSFFQTSPLIIMKYFAGSDKNIIGSSNLQKSAQVHINVTSLAFAFALVCDLARPVDYVAFVS